MAFFWRERFIILYPAVFGHESFKYILRFLNRPDTEASDDNSDLIDGVYTSGVKWRGLFLFDHDSYSQ